MTKSKKKTGTWGIRPRCYPKPLRWKVDWDYVHQLSPEERQWLATFGDNFYGADFRGDTEETWSTEQRRVSYSQKNAVNADLYGIGSVTGTLEFLEDQKNQRVENMATSYAPPDEYLDSEPYKAAREEFRRHLAKNRQNSNPAPSPLLDRAVSRLTAIVKLGRKGEEK